MNLKDQRLIKKFTVLFLQCRAQLSVCFVRFTIQFQLWKLGQGQAIQHKRDALLCFFCPAIFTVSSQDEATLSSSVTSSYPIPPKQAYYFMGLSFKREEQKVMPKLSRRLSTCHQIDFTPCCLHEKYPAGHSNIWMHVNGEDQGCKLIYLDNLQTSGQTFALKAWLKSATN